ncbi:MAG: hypothetical protein JWL97_2639 [Gemmatimonadales bacterium]|nr:hypothetical protein [Gemmatimonadales bacterium]
MIAPRITLVIAGLCPVFLAAQTTVPREAPHHVMVGSSDEDYLRYLQIAGLAPLYPWSLREFSQPELARMAVPHGSHPWSGKGDYKDSPSRYSFSILPVNAVLRYNSAFPYGSNDGAVWAGRGLTSALDLGFAFRFGPLSGTFNPIAFIAQNLAFPIQANGSPENPLADGLVPFSIDRPQRFGTHAYSRLDPGESTLRLDLLGVTGGISTANMGWGPMENYPYIMGGNAPGFPHVFMGTSSPVYIWIGRVHGRLIWGELEQSAYSPVKGTSYYSSLLETGTKRFASGAVAIFQPRGLDGLELGVARFFHSLWPRDGIPRSYFSKPFEAIFKVSLPTVSPGFGITTDAGIEDNQLASAFARWVFPKSGFEAYGEYGREDHNWSRRDFIQEPDHSRTYGLGLRKVMSADSSHLTAFRAEMINYELPTLARNRAEGGVYVHGIITQGHTNRGQPLGSDTGVGTGGGSLIVWDRYDRTGALSLGWTRTIREQKGDFYLTGITDPRASDVQNALTLMRTRYWGSAAVTTGLTVVREFNRDLRADAWNTNLAIDLRFGLSRERPRRSSPNKSEP